MATENAAVKKRLIAEIDCILKNEPELTIERDGHRWVALRTAYWLQVLDGKVSESTFRRWISKSPIVRRTYVVTAEDKYHLDGCEYERVLCLRLGQDSLSTMDRAKKLASIYRRSMPAKPTGWTGQSDIEYDACVEPTMTGWKAPDRRDLFDHFMKLADLWGDDAPSIFRYAFTHWTEFMGWCDGVDRSINYPSVRTMLRHAYTARMAWAYHNKAVATVKQWSISA